MGTITTPYRTIKDFAYDFVRFADYDKSKTTRGAVADELAYFDRCTARIYTKVVEEYGVEDMTVDIRGTEYKLIDLLLAPHMEEMGVFVTERSLDRPLSEELRIKLNEGCAKPNKPKFLKNFEAHTMLKDLLSGMYSDEGDAIQGLNNPKVKNWVSTLSDRGNAGLKHLNLRNWLKSLENGSNDETKTLCRVILTDTLMYWARKFRHRHDITIERFRSFAQKEKSDGVHNILVGIMANSVYRNITMEDVMGMIGLKFMSEVLSDGNWALGDIDTVEELRSFVDYDWLGNYMTEVESREVKQGTDIYMYSAIKQLLEPVKSLEITGTRVFTLDGLEGIGTCMNYESLDCYLDLDKQIDVAIVKSQLRDNQLRQDFSNALGMYRSQHKNTAPSLFMLPVISSARAEYIGRNAKHAVFFLSDVGNVKFYTKSAKSEDRENKYVDVSKMIFCIAPPSEMEQLHMDWVEPGRFSITSKKGIELPLEKYIALDKATVKSDKESKELEELKQKYKEQQTELSTIKREHKNNKQKIKMLESQLSEKKPVKAEKSEDTGKLKQEIEALKKELEEAKKPKATPSSLTVQGKSYSIKDVEDLLDKQGKIVLQDKVYDVSDLSELLLDLKVYKYGIQIENLSVDEKLDKINNSGKKVYVYANNMETADEVCDFIYSAGVDCDVTNNTEREGIYIKADDVDMSDCKHDVLVFTGNMTVLIEDIYQSVKN